MVRAHLATFWARNFLLKIGLRRRCKIIPIWWQEEYLLVIAWLMNKTVSNQKKENCVKKEWTTELWENHDAVTNYRIMNQTLVWCMIKMIHCKDLVTYVEITPGVNRNRDISRFSVKPRGKETFGLHIEINPGVIFWSCEELIFMLTPVLKCHQGSKRNWNLENSKITHASSIFKFRQRWSWWITDKLKRWHSNTPLR